MLSLHPPSLRRGFTLIEIVIVLMVIGLLVGIVAPKVQSQSARTRDTRRVQDLRTFIDAIEQFKLDHGDYPAPGKLVGGWDRSGDGDFLPELVNQGYVRAPLADPIEDATHYFAYRKLPAGTYGCVGPGSYYVIAIHAFETQQARNQFPSNFRCSGFDFGSQFAYATGGGASFQ
ncbi:MAG: prepilin-type N-terminal cleavage/methylation domain-containing protein [Planctomycetes bacterium]|nr:prepilin-type N-terminal cleavage/methylation domain-containing protein [Planctomycetota bacterium]HPF14468.1 prepilin-type N-terminal cleavage/methylation domain-containing protein [Planctomycetota bacterium]HRV80581.1 prepilin-type N-terminal cleavage/methylation domain-containing protein [Planctomycetota bacterium]